MKRLIEFPLGDGSTVLVEVDEPPIDGVERVARPGEVIRAETPFSTALSKLRPVAESIFAQLQGMRNQPDEVGVEFAFKLSGKMDFIIASAETEGNFKVSLTWKRDSTNQTDLKV